ncbi:MAG: HAMP domain-containing protein [Acidobacteriaceae bacterium]|nr:HAMP domain-containing protein [Acidobacteriaceae bacterium]
MATVRSYVEQEASGEGIKHLSEELNEDAVVNSASSYLRIVDQRGATIYASPNTADWPSLVSARQRLPEKGTFQTVQVHGRPFRIITAPVSIGRVQLGSPLEEFRELQQQFMWTAAFGIPLLLLIASGAGYWMGGRALRPVEKIATAARRITSANLSERLPYSGSKDELDRLSAMLNDMLAGLESAFRRITQFTADASHELRTPLAVIRTTAELMESRQRTFEEHRRAWASVLTQTERTTQLVDDLLTLARADAAVGALSVESVDVADVASTAVTDMHVLASAKGVKLQFSATTHPVIRGDEDALRRLFTILLDNALKATQPGGSVEVSVSEEYKEGHSRANIAVRDTGAGISAEDLPHIFDRFYRASKDRSRNTGGAGLGLAIAHWIVSQHGGTVHVQSGIGRGSIFQIILPATISTLHVAKTTPDSAILQN